jgi:hypothetical protein
MFLIATLLKSRPGWLWAILGMSFGLSFGGTGVADSPALVFLPVLMDVWNHPVVLLETEIDHRGRNLSFKLNSKSSRSLGCDQSIMDGQPLYQNRFRFRREKSQGPRAIAIEYRSTNATAAISELRALLVADEKAPEGPRALWERADIQEKLAGDVRRGRLTYQSLIRAEREFSNAVQVKSELWPWLEAVSLKKSRADFSFELDPHLDTFAHLVLELELNRQMARFARYDSHPSDKNILDYFRNAILDNSALRFTANFYFDGPHPMLTVWVEKIERSG